LPGEISRAAERVLPIEPLFRSDSDEMPLQAADLLAWFFRRRAAGGDPNDNEFDWLIPRLFTIPVSQFSLVFNNDQWKAKFQDTFTPSLIDNLTKRYDELFGDYDPPVLEDA
jgi:hypothetical protein